MHAQASAIVTNPGGGVRHLSYRVRGASAGELPMSAGGGRVAPSRAPRPTRGPVPRTPR